MRRALSIFLVLLFSLAPLAATLEASGDASLPPCCRRHGAHHCAMYARWRAQMASGKPSVSAPYTCPLFPGFGPPTVASIDGLAAATVAQPALCAQALASRARRNALRPAPLRTRAGRGPPVKLRG